MDSADRLWATFWVSAAAVVISILFAITYSATYNTDLKYKAQMFCMEKNAHWTTRITGAEPNTTTTYTCTFTR